MSVQSGRDAESRAAVFLAGRGYLILRRNYTVRGAEVDIIAKDGETYVFVEVKSLSSLAHGAPRERVTAEKQRRICHAALRFLQTYQLQDCPVRFDIVEITPQGPALLRGAFDFRG